MIVGTGDSGEMTAGRVNAAVLPQKLVPQTNDKITWNFIFSLTSD